MTALEGKALERFEQFAALGIRNVRVKTMLPGIDPVFVHYGPSLSETDIVLDGTWLDSASDNAVKSEFELAAAAIPSHFRKAAAMARNPYAARPTSPGSDVQSDNSGNRSSSGNGLLYATTAAAVISAASSSSSSCD